MTNIEFLLDSELNGSVCTTATTYSNTLRSPITVSTSMSKEFRSRMSSVICSVRCEIAPVVHLSKTEDSSSRPMVRYSAEERVSVSPAVSCYSLVDISDVNDEALE